MSVFPNSLELERRLRLLGAHPAQLDGAFEQLEDFQLRFRKDHYQLMGASQFSDQERATMAATLAHVSRTPPAAVIFESCERLEQSPREEQFRLYDLVRRYPIRLQLETEAYWRFANLREEGQKRRMIDVIKGAVGTRRLTWALDNTFGNSFASVFKHDIVAVWTMHFKSFVPTANGLADTDRIASTGRLVGYLTRALPIFHLPEAPGTWTVLTA